MKKLLVSAGALAALALSTPASAAATNTATADASVNIVSPLTLTKTADLNFGTLVGPFAGENVTVSAAGIRNCAGLTCAGTVSAATFDVTGGTASQPLTVTVDPTVDMASGANHLIANLTTPTGVSTDASGKASFGVGGSLTVASSTADGLYTGTFNVSVQYQ